MPSTEALSNYTSVITNWFLLTVQPTLKRKKQFVLEPGKKYKSDDFNHNLTQDPRPKFFKSTW